MLRSSQLMNRGAIQPFVCWSCAVKSRHVRSIQTTQRSRGVKLGKDGDHFSRRHFTGGQATHATVEPPLRIDGDLLPAETTSTETNRPRIRERLRQWEAENAHKHVHQIPPPDVAEPGKISNPGMSGESEFRIESDEGQFDFGLELYDRDSLVDVGDDRGFLLPGDLVELVSGGASRQELAILVRRVEKQEQFYTMSGRWVSRGKLSPKFFVPGFVESSELEPIIPYLPDTEVPKNQEDELHGFIVALPRNVGGPLVRKMLDFWSKADATYQRAASRLDRAHDLLAHPDRFSYATIQQISRKLLRDVIPYDLDGGYSMPILYAVHRAILRYEVGFEAQKYQVLRKGSLYEIHSKAELLCVSKVTSIVRGYRAAPIGSKESLMFSAFVKKARRNIDYSRSFRQFTPHGTLGPSSVSASAEDSNFRVGIEGEPWTAFDQTFLQFMESWSCLQSFSRSSALNGIGSEILRAMGRYDDVELDRTTAFTFLQEVGAIPPWEDRAAYDLRLPYTGRRLGVEYGYTPHTGYIPDAMKNLRKDWGEMTVYCVDDVGAFEIDDGISIEKTDNPDEYWIHAHIADPAAHMDPKGVAAKYSEYITTNIYFPERMLPMLNQQVVGQKFSLAPDRPCLTFSAKVDMNGTILETNITPGIIRNVVYCTPETLKRATTGEVPKPSLEYIVGSDKKGKAVGVARPLHKLKDFSQAQRKELDILEKLTTARNNYLSDHGGIFTVQPESQVSVDFAGQPWTKPRLNHAYWHHGDPTVRLSLSEMAEKTTSTKPDIVAVCMLLAGEVAGRWCSARGIPVIYRVTPLNPDSDPMEYYRQYVRPNRDENGNYPLEILHGYFRTIGKVIPSTTPGPHLGLGAEFVTRCTSPLRRFGDLLAHWQIEAALLREAETRQSLVGNTDDSYLPLSRAKIEQMLPRISSREKTIDQTTKLSGRIWTLHYLLRAWKFGQAKLPSPLIFTIRSVIPESKSAGGVLSDLLIGARLFLPAWIDPEKVQIDDKFEVEIESIDIPFRDVTVKIVRPIHTDSVRQLPIELMDHGDPLQLGQEEAKQVA